MEPRQHERPARRLSALAPRRGELPGTCIALERHDIIDAKTRDALLATTPRSIKAELLDGLAVENFFPDVWLLTERDEGSTIEGQPDDLFVLRLAEEFSPLKALVAKLKSQLAISGTNRGTYELGTVDPLLDIPIYDPASSDRNRPNGGPCLSHISVKLTADHRVMLTGVYRSHYWVQRTLGNLFGLAHLQHFIAQEAGLEMGPLICHSTMAQLETLAKRWNGRQVRDLVARCHAAHSLAAAA